MVDETKSNLFFKDIHKYYLPSLHKGKSCYIMVNFDLKYYEEGQYESFLNFYINDKIIGNSIDINVNIIKINKNNHYKKEKENVKKSNVIKSNNLYEKDNLLNYQNDNYNYSHNQNNINKNSKFEYKNKINKNYDEINCNNQ